MLIGNLKLTSKRAFQPNMQLAYIWVSEFRNIQNQGYNFSSKELINYDYERNSLRIETNSKYIQQFFGPSISNITGIIGQNASGKTNLLELINYVMDGGNTKIVKPFLALFENRGRYELFVHKLSTLPEITTGQRVTIKEYNTGGLPMNAVYFSNTFDGRRHNFGKRIIDVSTNRLFQIHTENIEQNIKRDVKAQLDFLSSDNLFPTTYRFTDINEQNNLVVRPTHIQLISPTWTSINYRARQFDKKFSINGHKGAGPMQLFCQSFRRKISDNESTNAMLYFLSFLLYVDIISTKDRDETQFYLPKDYSDLTPTVNQQLSKSDHKLLRGLSPERMTNMRINEIYQELTGSVADFLRSEYPDRKDRIDLLSSLQQYHFEEVTKLNEGVYSSRRIHFEAIFDPKMQGFLTSYLQATESSSLNLTIDWGGISSGQKAFLTLFSRLYAIRDQLEMKDVLLTIDEGDLYFHPKWQIEYLSRLINFLPPIFGVNVQLILTTHSPFLVSDLTKNHLIFLFKDHKKKSIAVPGRRFPVETFGGNIGELYLNAFFLNGSLISKFAADQIDRLAKKLHEQPQYLNQDDLRLIEQVGDEMIKNQLQHLRDDKN